MKRKWTLPLIGMGAVTLVLLAAASTFIWRSGLPFMEKNGNQLQAYIQVDPRSELGQDIQLSLTIENTGDSFVEIDEIRLPAALTDAAVIQEVFPSMYPGLHEFYDGWEHYPIGLILEPGELREFTIRMMPWQTADIASMVEVQAAEEVAKASFRTVFNKSVVIVPSSTPQPSATASWTPSPTSTVQPSATPYLVPYQVVVKIKAKVKYSSYLRDLWGGSGTIVSEDGLILTNAHLVLPVPGARPDVFVIAITEDPASPPIDRYYAVPVLTDEDLDLAVMRITTDVEFHPVNWEIIKLPAVTLGDSNTLQLGDPLTILGYPGIGGETITLTSGNVGGFTSQRAYGERAFIKTSATISGGTSGGTALNSQGQLIAVPTQLGSGEKEDVVDCRVITDTNGDGRINELDACVPVGGFINALRPINLARAMIESASQIIIGQ